MSPSEVFNASTVIEELAQVQKKSQTLISKLKKEAIFISLTVGGISVVHFSELSFIEQIIENCQDNILTTKLQAEIEDIDELDEMNETIKIYKENVKVLEPHF